MPRRNVEICDRCGRAAMNPDSESSGMVTLLDPERDTVLLLKRDIRVGEKVRPTFILTRKYYCPACLIMELSEWIEKSK